MSFFSTIINSKSDFTPITWKKMFQILGTIILVMTTLSLWLLVSWGGEPTQTGLSLFYILLPVYAASIPLKSEDTTLSPYAVLNLIVGVVAIFASIILANSPLVLAHTYSAEWSTFLGLFIPELGGCFVGGLLGTGFNATKP